LPLFPPVQKWLQPVMAMQLAFITAKISEDVSSILKTNGITTIANRLFRYAEA
jgi:hypothetical protein